MRMRLLPSGIHMCLRASSAQHNGDRRAPCASFRSIQQVGRQTGEASRNPFGKELHDRSTGSSPIAAVKQFPQPRCAVPNMNSRAAVNCCTGLPMPNTNRTQGARNTPGACRHAQSKRALETRSKAVSHQRVNDLRLRSMRGRIGVSPYLNFVPVICSYMAI